MADPIVTPDPQPTPQPTTESKKRRKRIVGVYEHGKRWQIDTFYKGIRLRESCATPEMAESVLRKLKTEIDENKYLDKKRESQDTVEQLADRYLAFCEGKRQKSLRSKRTQVARIVDYFGKESLVCKIGVADIEGFQTALSKTLASRKQTTLKSASINRTISTVKHLLHKAAEWGIVEKNSADGVRQYKEKNRRLRYLTAEEVKRLLDACPTPVLRDLITLALNTGMRRGELLNLKWRYVNLRESYLELEDQKNQDTGENATVPLNATAVDVLRSIPRRLDSEYVFTGLIPGEPFYDLKRQFEKAVTAAGLQGVTFHTLRHTSASQMVMAGVDLATVRDILRHKEYKTTLRYSHLSQDHKKSAVEALANALAGKAENEAKTA